MIQILKYGQLSKEEIFARDMQQMDVSAVVYDIISRVRSDGDSAILDYCRQFDGVELTALAVTEEEIQEAFEAVEPQFLEILQNAAENIRSFTAARYATALLSARKTALSPVRR